MLLENQIVISTIYEQQISLTYLYRLEAAKHRYGPTETELSKIDPDDGYVWSKISVNHETAKLYQTSP